MGPTQRPYYKIPWSDGFKAYRIIINEKHARKEGRKILEGGFQRWVLPL